MCMNDFPSIIYLGKNFSTIPGCSTCSMAEIIVCEIYTVDPVAPMMAIKNVSLGSIAVEVRNKLKKAIDNL